jgi:hypothetical protein
MKVSVVFPNDDYPFEIEMERLENFKVESEFDNCMFGWWDDTYIKVLKVKSKNEEGETVYTNPFDK